MILNHWDNFPLNKASETPAEKCVLLNEGYINYDDALLWARDRDLNVHLRDRYIELLTGTVFDFH